MRITSRVINHLTTTVSFAPFHTSFRKQLILGHSSGVSCKLVIIIDGQILTDSRLSPSLLVKLQFTLPYFLCAPSIDRCRCVDFDYPARPFDFFFFCIFFFTFSSPHRFRVVSLYLSSPLIISTLFPLFSCYRYLRSYPDPPCLTRQSPIFHAHLPHSLANDFSNLQCSFASIHCVFHLATIFISWCHLWYL